MAGLLRASDRLDVSGLGSPVLARGSEIGEWGKGNGEWDGRQQYDAALTGMVPLKARISVMVGPCGSLRLLRPGASAGQSRSPRTASRCRRKFAGITRLPTNSVAQRYPS